MPTTVAPNQTKTKTGSEAALENRAKGLLNRFGDAMAELRGPEFYSSAHWLFKLHDEDPALFNLVWYRYTEKMGRVEPTKTLTVPQQRVDLERACPPTEREKMKSECDALGEALTQRIPSRRFASIIFSLRSHFVIGDLFIQHHPLWEDNDSKLAAKVMRLLASTDNLAHRDLIMRALSNGAEFKGDVLNEDMLAGRIHRIVNGNKELRLFIIWGGVKWSEEGTADLWDEKAVETLKAIQGRVRAVYPNTSVELIICDVHAADFAGKPLEHVYRYAGNQGSAADAKTLHALAKKHGLKMVPLSEIYDYFKGRGMQGELARAERKEYLKSREILKRDVAYARLLDDAAEKHSDLVREGIKKKEQAALDYLARRRFEAKLFQMWCPDAVFLSFAGDTEREKYIISSPIPVICIYPYRKSTKSDLPWFRDMRTEDRESFPPQEFEN